MNAYHVPDTMLSMADRIVSKWSKYFLYKRVYRLLKWRKNNTHTNTHTHTHYCNCDKCYNRKIFILCEPMIGIFGLPSRSEKVSLRK